MSVTVRANPARLTWSHFRRVASISGTSEYAQTASKIFPLRNIRPESNKNGRFQMPSATLRVGLDQLNTMVLRSASRTADLLQHEQGHFDLLVLVARAIARDLEAIEVDSVDKLVLELDDVMARHNERAQAIDAEYDRQTEHSRSKAAQAKWYAAIGHAMRTAQPSMVVGMSL